MINQDLSMALFFNNKALFCNIFRRSQFHSYEYLSHFPFNLQIIYFYLNMSSTNDWLCSWASCAKLAQSPPSVAKLKLQGCQARAFHGGIIRAGGLWLHTIHLPACLASRSARRGYAVWPTPRTRAATWGRSWIAPAWGWGSWQPPPGPAARAKRREEGGGLWGLERGHLAGQQQVPLISFSMCSSIASAPPVLHSRSSLCISVVWPSI